MNQALAFDCFSFVDLSFVVDPPLAADGGYVDHEGGDFELFSFVHGSDVVVYVSLGMAGLFKVVMHDGNGASIGFVYRGEDCVVRGIYSRPEMFAEWWDRSTECWGGVDWVMGDMNARHRDWEAGDSEVVNSHGRCLKTTVTRYGFNVI